MIDALKYKKYKKYKKKYNHVTRDVERVLRKLTYGIKIIKDIKRKKNRSISSKEKKGI